MIGYTDISNQELDELIIRYKQNHSCDGERMMIGYLHSENIHLSRQRICECIHRVDPAGVRSRTMGLIQQKPIMLKDPITSGTWMAITN